MGVSFRYSSIALRMDSEIRMSAEAVLGCFVKFRYQAGFQNWSGIEIACAKAHRIGLDVDSASKRRGVRQPASVIWHIGDQIKNYLRGAVDLSGEIQVFGNHAGRKTITETITAVQSRKPEVLGM